MLIHSYINVITHLKMVGKIKFVDHSLIFYFFKSKAIYLIYLTSSGKYLIQFQDDSKLKINLKRIQVVISLLKNKYMKI